MNHIWTLEDDKSIPMCKRCGAVKNSNIMSILSKGYQYGTSKYEVPVEYLTTGFFQDLRPCYEYYGLFNWVQNLMPKNNHTLEKISDHKYHCITCKENVLLTVQMQTDQKIQRIIYFGIQWDVVILLLCKRH